MSDFYPLYVLVRLIWPINPLTPCPRTKNEGFRCIDSIFMVRQKHLPSQLQTQKIFQEHLLSICYLTTQRYLLKDLLHQMYYLTEELQPGQETTMIRIQDLDKQNSELYKLEPFVIQFTIHVVIVLTYSLGLNINRPIVFD